jgi:hypothetical protein
VRKMKECARENVRTSRDARVGSTDSIHESYLNNLLHTSHIQLKISTRNLNRNSKNLHPKKFLHPILNSKNLHLKQPK